MTILLHGRVSCSILPVGQAIKLFYGMVVLLMIIILHSQICKAEQFTCHHNVNYTKGSRFERNLNTVMNRLTEAPSQTGFNSSEYGQSPDQIYGLLQCRGDTTGDQCYNCSQQANNTLRQNCGYAAGGLIWFDFCFLRYENYSFMGQLDTVDGWYLWNTQNVSASPDVFNKALDDLFTKLLAEATFGSKLYAAGTTRDSLFRKIYAMVQCTRDMSVDNCTTCLSQTIANIFASYSGRQGARGLLGSCMVRYEMYSFFNSVSSPPPVEAPASIPAAHTRPNQTTPSTK